MNIIGKMEECAVETTVSVNEAYDAMSEGERQHMANKLWKHKYRSPKSPYSLMTVVWETDEYLLIEREAV